MNLPRIISIDDHVVEPPHVWQERLPPRFKDVGPRVVRRRVRGADRLVGGAWMGPTTLEDADASDPDARDVDFWLYEDLVWPLTRGFAHSGYEDEDGYAGITYDDVLPAAHDRAARVKTLDDNYTDMSLTFPTFPRFCGQTFLEAKDRELGLLCVQAYNDWMIDEWCAGEALHRLIPLTLVPLWDAELAAVEVRRTADKGAHAICFTEQPVALGQPSLYTGYWEPLWQACDETATVVNMHIGSSSKLPTTSPDAPTEVLMTLNTMNSIMAMTDWVISGILERHPGLKIAFSEAQVGWIPYYAQRMDTLWAQNIWDHMQTWLPKPPSHYVRTQVYGCVMDDLVGLRNRDLVGMDQIMFETDFPHADSTFPNSKSVAEKLVVDAGLSEHETWQLVRGNAIACYGLERWGITN